MCIPYGRGCGASVRGSRRALAPLPAPLARGCMGAVKRPRPACSPPFAYIKRGNQLHSVTASRCTSAGRRHSGQASMAKRKGAAAAAEAQPGGGKRRKEGQKQVQAAPPAAPAPAAERAAHLAAGSGPVRNKEKVLVVGSRGITYRWAGRGSLGARMTHAPGATQGRRQPWAARPAPALRPRGSAPPASVPRLVISTAAGAAEPQIPTLPCPPQPLSRPAPPPPARRPLRFRHLMLDVAQLLPHGKKDAKLDGKSDRGQATEVAELKGCTAALYFEARKHKDLYLWLAKTPAGPSAKFHVSGGEPQLAAAHAPQCAAQSAAAGPVHALCQPPPRPAPQPPLPRAPAVHTMAELKLSGNHLKGSRPVLSFDK